MKKIFYILLFIAALNGCVTMNSMVNGNLDTYAKYDNHCLYKVSNKNESGFDLSLMYHNLPPNLVREREIARAKESYRYISKKICQESNGKFLGIDNTYLVNAKSSLGMAGTFYVKLENHVNCLQVNKSSEKKDKLIKKKKEDSKYSIYFKSIVVIKTNSVSGSGFFITNDGLLVTNYHVVENDASPSIQFNDGTVLIGKVVEVNKQKDLALVKVPVNTSFLTLETLENTNVGDEVIAIGTPLNYDYSISKGIISAIRVAKGITVLQTDCAINSGNSGGPLISLDSGKVVGVNSFGIQKNIAEGLNFAITADEIIAEFDIEK